MTRARARVRTRVRSGAKILSQQAEHWASFHCAAAPAVGVSPPAGCGVDADASEAHTCLSAESSFLKDHILRPAQGHDFGSLTAAASAPEFSRRGPEQFICRQASIAAGRVLKFRSQ
jgi:hypothetical protein